MLDPNLFIPPRIKKLPRDHRDFPIPWFVAVLQDGTRDFRVADEKKKYEAIRFGKCWVCGEPTGTYKAFVIGPMCVVNRTTAEPPCHLDCAVFSVQACPFLSRPKMRRNEKDMPGEGVDPPGIMIKRNPGVICIYISRRFSWREGLIRLMEPHETMWFSEGKPANREQVIASIESGFPALLELAMEEGPEAVKQLTAMKDRAMLIIPPERANEEK